LGRQVLHPGEVNMKVRNLSKLPRRRVTVDDVLGTDDVVTLISELSENRHIMDELVVIYKLRDMNFFHFLTNGMPESRLVYVIDSVKHSILSGDDGLRG